MYLAYSFEEIMAYHPDNKDVYSEIKENLPNLVPFVGAGLTRFAYHSWKDALMELAGKITNRDDSKQVRKLIRDGHYMYAAQKLENLGHHQTWQEILHICFHQGIWLIK